jgi:hypothetical protein
MQKDMTPASRKSASNRRFSYKFNFVLDTEDAMMCCKKRKKTTDVAKQTKNRANLQAFQKKIIDQNMPVDQRVARGAPAPIRPLAVGLQ